MLWRGTRQAMLWMEAYHTAQDAQEMVLIQVAMQEQHCKQGCKEHLRAPHHLIHTGCHTEQADVHQHRSDQVEDCWNG